MPQITTSLDSSPTHELTINKSALDKATRESIRSSLACMFESFEELATFDDLLLLDGILEKWRDYVPRTEPATRSLVLQCISELLATPDSEETVASDPDLDEAIAKAEAEPSLPWKSDAAATDPWAAFPLLRERLRNYSQTLLDDSISRFTSAAQGFDRILMDLILEDWDTRHDAAPTADNLLLDVLRDLTSREAAGSHQDNPDAH